MQHLLIFSASSLCAIPLNEEFVFMSTEKHIDRLGHTLKKLMLGCRPGATVDVQAPFCSQTDSEHCFHNFLHVHIQQARNKGFDDAVSFGRHSQQYLSYFEVFHLLILIEHLYFTSITVTDTKSLGASLQSCLQHCNAVRTDSVAVHGNSLF